MDNDLIKYINKIKRNKKIIIFSQILIIISFLLIWQLLSDLKIINSFIFSSPYKILITIKELFINNIINHIYITFKEVIIAFILCFIISFIIALLLYLFNTLYKILDPFINILNSLPKISLGPILIIWFGANTKTIIIMGLLINIIVCIQTLYTGFNNVNKYHLLLFKSYKANKIQTIIYLIIPSSINNIITALKLNISMTLVGVIMGEFLVSKAGLGYLIIYGTQVFNLNLVYASIFILLVLSYLLYKPIKLLENKIKNT